MFRPKAKSPKLAATNQPSYSLKNKLRLKMVALSSLALLALGLTLSTNSINSFKLSFSNTAFANNTNTNTIQFKKTECTDNFKKLATPTPKVGIVVDDTTWQVELKDGERQYKPSTSALDTLLAANKDDPPVKALAEICYCNSAASIDSIYKVLNPPKPAAATPATPDPTYKDRKQAAEWIRHHKNLFCKYIQTTEIKAPATAGGATNIQYCKIEQSSLNQDNLDINDFRAFDTNNDCQIMTNEKCELDLYKARQTCSSNSLATKSQLNLNGVANVTDQNACQQLNKIYCDGTTKKILDLGEFDSTQLNTKTLTVEDEQTGFQEIEDQGAGENNPAINFILNIINILTNLAFFVSMFFLIMGGFYMVMASNNSEMQDKGKNAIKYFVFGISFVLLSYLLVVLIEGFLF
jgi:hypothetical protein